jgi:hypothetical protein
MQIRRVGRPWQGGIRLLRSPIWLHAVVGALLLWHGSSLVRQSSSKNRLCFFIVFLENDQILRIDMDKKNVKTRDRRSSETEAEDSPSSVEQKKNKCCAILHRGSVFPQVYLPKRAARPWHYTTLCLLCRAVSSHRAKLSAQTRHYGSLTVPCR